MVLIWHLKLVIILIINNINGYKSTHSKMVKPKFKRVWKTKLNGPIKSIARNGIQSVKALELPESDMDE